MSEYFSHEPIATISILFGGILILVGILFKIKPPRKINSIYGYRTVRSMKDQAHWDFAHQYSANVSIYLGLASMAAAPIGWQLELSEIAETLIGVAWMIIICFALFNRTEKAIKKKFEE